MKQFSLKKKTRRQLKKGAKALRKAWKHAGGPVGLTTGLLALGGLAAHAALDPELRQKTRELASNARDLFRQLTAAGEGKSHDQPRLSQAHA
jgi:hypothetical protein